MFTRKKLWTLLSLFSYLYPLFINTYEFEVETRSRKEGKVSHLDGQTYQNSTTRDIIQVSNNRHLRVNRCCLSTHKPNASHRVYKIRHRNTNCEQNALFFPNKTCTHSPTNIHIFSHKINWYVSIFRLAFVRRIRSQEVGKKVILKCTLE